TPPSPGPPREETSMPPLYRVAATVRSLNKNAVGDNANVEAKDPTEARLKGRKALQKKHPNGNVEVVKVEVKRPGPPPKPKSWW
ncbi:hypothetical protein ACWGLS_30595, partial [Streptomyces albidoflavus]